MKFDLIVGNPPYCRNLHLKLIQATLPYLAEDGEALFVHPARWVEDPLWKWKKNCDRVKFKDIVEMINDVKLIKQRDAYDLFGNLAFTMDLMVGTYKRNPSKKFNTVFSTMIENIISKVVGYSQEDQANNLASWIDKSKNDGLRVKINALVGKGHSDYSPTYNLKAIKATVQDEKSIFVDGKDQVSGKDWYNCFNSNGRKKEAMPTSIKFESEDIAKNFVKSCNCNFFWNLVHVIEWDVNVPLAFLPWMHDYSHVWTDEDYCKFFKLNEEEAAFMSRDINWWLDHDLIEYTKV